MPDSDVPLFYQSPWIPLLFVAGAVGISVLFSVLSGWRSLARRFPPRALAGGERFRFASAKMGLYRWFPVSYGGLLGVTVTEEGVAMSICQPFRLLCPDFFVPWSAVQSVNERVAFLSRRKVVRIRDSSVEIALRGPAGDAVAATFARLDGGSAE